MLPSDKMEILHNMLPNDSEKEIIDDILNGSIYHPDGKRSRPVYTVGYDPYQQPTKTNPGRDLWMSDKGMQVANPDGGFTMITGEEGMKDFDKAMKDAAKSMFDKEAIKDRLEFLEKHPMRWKD